MRNIIILVFVLLAMAIIVAVAGREECTYSHYTPSGSKHTHVCETDGITHIH